MVIVYKVIVEIFHKDTDMDMCPISVWDTVFEDIFEHEEVAISKANEEFNSRNLNGHVTAVHAEVVPLEITDEGWRRRHEERYNLYKSDVTSK